MVSTLVWSPKLYNAHGFWSSCFQQLVDEFVGAISNCALNKGSWLCKCTWEGQNPQLGGAQKLGANMLGLWASINILGSKIILLCIAGLSIIFILAKIYFWKRIVGIAGDALDELFSYILTHMLVVLITYVYRSNKNNHVIGAIYVRYTSG